jgi:DNA polymerase sigma
LHKLARALRRADAVTYVEVIAKARIPIIKFTDKETGIKVDVCFDVEGGCETVAFVNAQQRLLPAMRPLTLVLKLFLSCRGLNEPFRGGIGGYLLQLMILSHLRLHDCAVGKERDGNDDDDDGGGGGCKDGGRGPPKHPSDPRHPKHHKKRKKGEMTGDVKDYEAPTTRAGDKRLRKNEGIDVVNLGSLLLSFFHTYGCLFNYSKVGLRIARNGACSYSKICCE